MRIKQLSTLVANQIAAGEVIERPASVVKELLENSQDAGAQNITIELAYGGLNLIKISDDGHGIFRDDLPLAVVAHATSKIANLDDLYAISSMGFRGEALASIAAVAKLVITSRPKPQAHAAKLDMTNDKINLIPAARSIGTTIEVVDLFYNAPVRKKFLRSERTELMYVEDTIKRFALAAPHISLNVRHNGKEIWQIPAANCQATRNLRIKKIFGAQFVNSAIEVKSEVAAMRIHGAISCPDYQRSQRDKIWIYLNNRMLRDKLLQRAVLQVYQDYLTPGRYPACLLYLEMPSADVDVNVHPTKHEVRFKNPRAVHDFLIATLSKALPDINPVTPQYEYNGPNLATPSKASAVKLETLPFAPLQFLSPGFAIYRQQQQVYLLDFAKAYSAYIQSTWQQELLPRQKRPLLVPVRTDFSASQCLILQKLQDNLNNLGIEFDFLSATQIIIRSLPMTVPRLNLQQLFAIITNSSRKQEIDLESLCLRCQDLSSQDWSASEQRQVMDWLQSMAMLPKFVVQLTEQVCQGLFVDG